MEEERDEGLTYEEWVQREIDLAELMGSLPEDYPRCPRCGKTLNPISVQNPPMFCDFCGWKEEVKESIYTERRKCSCKYMEPFFFQAIEESIRLMNRINKPGEDIEVKEYSTMILNSHLKALAKECGYENISGEWVYKRPWEQGGT